MAYQKKTWVNRQSEYPNRRRLTAVAGGSNLYEVSREEGLVVVEGDPFDQVSMNALETRVENAFAELVNGTVKAGKATAADTAAACTGNAATATWANTAATANNANMAYGKTENALNVSTAATCTGNAATATRATTAATADNAAKAYGKSENALSVSYAASAGAVSWGAISGRPTSFPADIHFQEAYTIKAGILQEGVLATTTTDYGTSRLRNAYFATSRPYNLSNGTICFVYE